MIKILPFILIPILVLAGLGYWRYSANNNLVTPVVSQQTDTGPVEVPKALPNATLEDRVKVLEDTALKLATQVNSWKSPQANTSSQDSRISDLEASNTELKARISALEKATPAPAAASGKSTIYIPLGSGGTNGDKNWITNDNYGVTIDPAEYLGYSTMQLEVNFRMVQKSGTAYARFYNVTDSSDKEKVSTTSDSFSWQTSFGFTLPAGKKTYTLQTKSTEGVEIQLQSARIKVNF